MGVCSLVAVLWWAFCLGLEWAWVPCGDTVPVRCGLCVHGDGVPANVYGASDDWCTGLQCLLAVWWWLGWFVGGFDCAVVFVVRGDARPLLLSPCHTCIHTRLQ